jgi:hypothetical protein
VASRVRRPHRVFLVHTRDRPIGARPGTP